MAITKAMREKLAQRLVRGRPGASLDTEALVKGYLSGKSVKELSVEFDCSYQTVYKRLRMVREGE